MKLSKILIAALTLLVGVSCSKAPDEKVEVVQNHPKISVQLWSVKDQVKADFTGTLKKLADMGFQGVEFANEFGELSGNPAAIRQALDNAGLVGSGAHVSFEQLNDENLAETVSFYQTLGVDMLIVGWDERAWHPEGVKEVVQLLNDVAKKLAPFNMKTGFHNHDHEFDDFLGSTYWDFLAVNTDDNVVLQQDVGWTTYAGKDPVAYVNKYPGRTLTTHYKVKLPEGTQGKLPIIGQDTIDWLNLTKANIAVGGTLWLVVEQEEYPNNLTPLQAVEASKKGLMEVLKRL